MSEWMSRCVERVEERLKLLPQILQLKLLSCKRQHSVSVKKPGSIRFKCRNAVKAKSERFVVGKENVICGLYVKDVDLKRVSGTCALVYFRYGGPYLRVNRSVLIQAHCVSEGFSAYPTLKRPRAAVRPPHVNFQPVRRGEHLWKTHG